MPTTLYAAASAGDLAGVDRRLLHEGVDVVTETGNTALHGAAAAGGLRMCSYLLHSKGANPTIQNATGDTPLHMAARWGHAEVVTFFLLNIVDHTITNHRNETAHDVAPPEIKEIFAKAGNMARLSFVRQPEVCDAGSTFAARVDVVDHTGKKMPPAAPLRISLRLCDQPADTPALLHGELSKQVGLAGAFFSKLRIPQPGIGYSLQAVADNDSVLPCTSEPFDILCHVAFVNVPEVNDIGDDLKVQVQIRDQRDGLIPFDTTVTLTLHESGASGAFCNDPALLTAEVAQGEATFLGLRLSHVGKGFVISAKASSACVQDGVSAPITVKGRLVFAMQPSDTDVGHAVKVVVHVQDSQGRRVETCDTLIAVAIKPQSPSMSLGGGKSTRMCHAGEVAFDDLFIDTPGAGYVLTATAKDLTGIVESCESKPFTMTARLIIVQEPRDMQVGALFAVGVKVQAANGEDVNTAAPHVSLSLSREAAGGVLKQVVNGIITKRAMRGEASFQELSVEVPGTGYVLIATSESSFIASARSAPFAVHGALAFTTPPPSQMFMGATFCTAVQVHDDWGRRFAGGATAITLQLDEASPHGRLEGNNSIRLERSEALFGSLMVPHAGRQFRLKATTDNEAIAPAVSPPFDVTAKMYFEQSPTKVNVSESFAVRLCTKYPDGTRYKDQYDVTLRLAKECRGALLGDLTQMVDADGWVMFPAVCVDTPGSGFTLEAISSNTGMLPATSHKFDAIANFVFLQNPQTHVAGAPTGATVAVHDVHGKVVPVNAEVSLSLPAAASPSSEDSGLVWPGLFAAQVVNGIAECPDIPLSGPALGLTLQATCPANAAIQPATSSPFDRTARLAFRELPAVVEAQSELTVEVVVRDCNDEIMVLATPQVHLQIRDDPDAAFTGVQLCGQVTVQAVRGRALFSGVYFNTAVHKGLLTARCVDNAAISPVTQGIDARAYLRFATQPQGPVDVNSPFGCRVQIVSAAGAQLRAQTPLRLELQAGASSGVLAGLVSRGGTESDGMFSEAVFAGLSIDCPGAGYVLTATAVNNEAVVPCTCEPFDVTGTLCFAEGIPATDVSDAFSTTVEVVDYQRQRVPKAQGRVAVHLLDHEVGSATPQSTWHELVDGAALIDGIRIDTPHAQHVLCAVGDRPVVLAAQSAPFGITAQLRFCPPPRTTDTNAPFDLAVEIVDCHGRRVLSSASDVTIALRKRDSPPGTLEGGLVQSIGTDGTAQFTGLTIDSPGKSFVMTATSSVLSIPQCCSPIFHSTARLSIEEAPSDGIPVWSHFSIKVVIRDANLHKITTVRPTIRLRFKEGCPSQRLGGGSISQRVQDGEAFFGELLIDTPGVYIVVAQADNEAIECAFSLPFRVEGSMVPSAAPAPESPPRIVLQSNVA